MIGTYVKNYSKKIVTNYTNLVKTQIIKHDNGGGGGGAASWAWEWYERGWGWGLWKPKIEWYDIWMAPHKCQVERAPYG